MLENLATVSAGSGRWKEAAAAWRTALSLRPSAHGASSLRAAATAFERAKRFGLTHIYVCV